MHESYRHTERFRPAEHHIIESNDQLPDLSQVQQQPSPSQLLSPSPSP